ncbi:MAG TPA: DoxX family protein, partial [Bdellovibrionales bacterium]|nr:DoxX family protein [Bdellovibrionales bacterium]
LAELGGGFLLAVGFFTRPAAFFAGITMFVASFMAHSSDPFQKQELSLIYLAMFLIFVALGGGRFSIDRLFRKG